MFWFFCIIGAVCAYGCIVVMSKNVRELKELKKPSHDHDMTNNLPSETSTSWEYHKCCPSCFNDISHREFMTDICLSCGTRMPMSGRQATSRKVFLRGEWRVHFRHGNRDYIQVSGKWELLKNFLGPVHTGKTIDCQAL